jgi:hypothetical protein
LIQLEEEDESAERKVDWTRMFLRGSCPADVEGMKSLKASELTGDWYMHRCSRDLFNEITPTCHHARMKINEDGSFNAIEEAQFLGHKFIAEDIVGQFTDSNVRADFFDSKLSVKVRVLDTDYENYLVGYECFDNMKFALENEVEPVHIIKMAILTHKPDESADYLNTLEDKVISMLPFWNKEDFEIVK